MDVRIAQVFGSENPCARIVQSEPSKLIAGACKLLSENSLAASRSWVATCSSSWYIDVRENLYGHVESGCPICVENVA